MIRLEDDIEPADRVYDPPHIVREIAVLAIPPVIMLVGFLWPGLSPPFTAGDHREAIAFGSALPEAGDGEDRLVGD